MVNNYSHPYSNSQAKIPTAVVGARGYSGLDLAKLLLSHPHVDLKCAFATRPFSLKNELMLERAGSVACLTDDQIMRNLDGVEVFFLATPAEVSMELAPALLQAGKFVIDLSGAFRGQDHFGVQPASIEYGLVPFCGPRKVGTRLVSNPGCYATAAQLALVPLLKHDVIEAKGVAIDAKSGTTGAGRKAAENQLFAEVADECMPYRVGVHQHLPEIQKYVEQYSGRALEPHFVTHLLPTKRGIECAIFATSKTRNIKDITEAFAVEYASYPLVRFGEDYARLAKLAHVVQTPYTHISYQLIGDKLYVFSVLDNLMKGAASQAVENFNRMFDFPLTQSLIGEA